MARSRTGDPDIGEIGVAIDDVMAVVAIFGLADARGDDRLALQPGHPAGDIVLDLALQERGRHPIAVVGVHRQVARSEEHTSELQSLMRISYAVFCLKKTKSKIKYTKTNILTITR